MCTNISSLSTCMCSHATMCFACACPTPHHTPLFVQCKYKLRAWCAASGALVRTLPDSTMRLDLIDEPHICVRLCVCLPVPVLRPALVRA